MTHQRSLELTRQWLTIHCSLWRREAGSREEGEKETDRPALVLQPTDVEPKAPRAGKSLVSQDSQDEVLSTLPHVC